MCQSDGGVSWPVIIHQGMSHTGFSTVLQQKQLKVRYSETIVPGSIIFPLSGIAFIMIPLAQAVLKDNVTKEIQLTQELTERLDKFLQVHRKCYLLCQATLHGPNEQTIFSLIQRKYLNTRLNLLIVHNVGESVKTMLTIAEGLCKPLISDAHTRIESALQDYLQTDFLTASLKQIGLSDHCQVIADGLGSLTKLVMASREELIDCSLDSNTINTIQRFFHHSEP